ncbi:MAG: DAK2 domain-containing protein [Tissierellia bacterium]|nr:DAK2 domain-containing protein [Tissierellia bacterium]
MEIQMINGKILKSIFDGAVNYLVLHKDEVNALNVFPVPDGDTGTNMSLTAKSALKQIQELGDDSSVSDIAKAAARGSLMGARGNSGVILSQLLRGFAEGLEGLKEANISDLAHAMKQASETTYKAVMKPIEGTILTVGRETSEFAMRNHKKFDDMDSFLEKVIEEANSSLENTPHKLPVLKEAGVVDAGGKGLVLLMEGAFKVFRGEEVESLPEDEGLKKKKQQEIHTGPADESLRYGYCTEFIIHTDYEDTDAFKEKLAPLGDCLLVVGGEGTGLIKVHLHTNHPGKALEYACELGLLQDIKIDNMRFQHRETLFGEDEVEAARQDENQEMMVEKEYSFITVSMGEGMKELFESFNVDYIVEGGQTMNPSTEDLLKGIEAVKGKNIFILPNNGNIILAAEQARDLSEKNVVVIPTKSIPQGVSALLSFHEDRNVQDNKETMMESLKTVIDAQITYAVRDTEMNGRHVQEGDIIGLSGKQIMTSGSSVEEVTKDTITQLMNEDISIITLYYGEDVTKEEAEDLRDQLEEEYEDLDVEIVKGLQPIYYYILSLD